MKFVRLLLKQVDVYDFFNICKFSISSVLEKTKVRC